MSPDNYHATAQQPRSPNRPHGPPELANTDGDDMTYESNGEQVRAKFGSKEWAAVTISLVMMLITSSTVVYTAGRQGERLEALSAQMVTMVQRMDAQQQLHMQMIERQAALSERIARMESTMRNQSNNSGANR